MSTAAELFSYNRENFKFNKELRQRNLYGQQKMRVSQVMLYRQDLKDLFDLTVGKMDAYMMVNVLMLGITAEMFYKGRSPQDVPGWLFWCWSISLSASFYFIFFSTWLALHASVLAHTYMARTLTQWLRLPIPSMDEIDAGSARLEEYENSSFLDFVRPPVVVPMVPELKNQQAMLESKWNEFNDHFVLFTSLHTKWQAHEAYARVAMCFGTHHLLSSFTYFSLMYWAVNYDNPWIGGVFVILATVAQLIHIRMSLNLSMWEHYVGVALVVLAPLLITASAALCTTLDVSTGTVIVPDSALVLAAIGYAFHFAWVIFFLHHTNNKNSSGLPLKFSTVWCLDILGFGIETIRDIEEPLIDFPGFISQADVPVTSKMSESTVSDEVKNIESKLDRLFSFWAKKSHQLTHEELEYMEILKREFDSDVARTVRSDGNAAEWIRLNYETDTGESAPYLLNPATGEIKWEEVKEMTMEINRGLSLLPEQLQAYREMRKKNEYSARRARAVKRQPKPPQWPWDYFKLGGILVMVCWVSALIEMYLDWAGIEPAFGR